jgi:1,4-alpha-glucan branching enzyme
MLPGVVKLDPWLAPFKESLKQRYSKAQQWIKTIDETEGGLEKFSRVGQPHTTSSPY